MSKINKGDEMRQEYDFSSGVRGKHFRAYQEEFYSRWYVRYLSAAFMLAWAYACYIIYTKGMTLKFLEYKPGLPSLMFTLLLNPITGIVVTIIAIFNAWEISLIVIAGVVLYYTYLGIAALPVSVAIIIGSIIIAVVLRKIV